MAYQKATTVLFMCALLFLSFVARIEGSQNCYCECMKKCIPLGIVSEQECSKECDEACMTLGFDGKPEGGMDYCRKLES
ncbi:unnamed protein product [Musa hybrid cultivar]